MFSVVLYGAQHGHWERGTKMNIGFWNMDTAEDEWNIVAGKVQ